MRTRRSTWRTTVLASVLGAAAAVTTMTAFEPSARACGGCFSPPEIPTVVTDHRMLLSISPDQSTLYDQIEYSGEPSAFAWVLPIAGTVDVGLSADVVFGQLDQLTQTVITAPPRVCPPPPPGCAVPATAPPPPVPPPSGGVDVIKQEVVGPYETVQLQATDPNALETYLAGNGFALPADVEPIVDQYVAESFNFLALKLLPGKGVQDMRPVRVTTPGANVSLPLRMVSAGTGATVGITLWVLGEGRYEPQNFPSFHVEDSEITWDWAARKSDYTTVRAARAAAAGAGRAWEIESSIDLDPAAFQYQIIAGGSPDATTDYLPVTDAGGAVTKTAAQARDEDLATMFHGIGAARVTRLRGDIAHAALDRDLVMIASADQGKLPNRRTLTRSLDAPPCPTYAGCDPTGQDPSGGGSGSGSAGAGGSGGGGTFRCAVPATNAGFSGANGGPTGSLLALGGGALALALGGVARRRRRDAARDMK
jgi:hypothetical protein